MAKNAEDDEIGFATQLQENEAETILDGNLTSRAALITYAQSGGLSVEDVKKFYLDKYNDVLYLIVEEKHEDGNPHIHIYLERPRDLQIRGRIDNAFDIWGDIDDDGVMRRKKFHAHVRKAFKKSRMRIICYLLKQQILEFYNTPDQDFLCNLSESIMQSAILMLKEKQIVCPDADLNWLVAISLAEKGDFAEAVQVVRQSYPKDYILHHNDVMKTLKSLYKCQQKVFPLDTFIIPEGVRFYMDNHQTNRSLYVFGKGDSGKTQMCRSLLQHLIDIRFPGKRFTFFSCNGSLDELQHYNPALHKGVIFDDSDVNELKPEQILQVLSVKDESTIKCRYRNGVVPQGHFKFITSNRKFEEWIPKMANDDQLLAAYNRVVIVGINNKRKLYRVIEEEQRRWENNVKVVFDENIIDDGEHKENENPNINKRRRIATNDQLFFPSPSITREQL